tara:strand:+ start:2559 stop:2660 length:102 start_codon:yes stop_codon:yes gene_type:complete
MADAFVHDILRVAKGFSAGMAQYGVILCLPVHA